MQVFTVALKVAFTYLAVVVAQVFFRASSAGDAVEMLKSMMGLNTPLPLSPTVKPTYDFVENILMTSGLDLGEWYQQIRFDAPFTLLIGFVVVWSLPNVMQIMARYKPSLSKIGETVSALVWRPNVAWGLGMGAMAAVAMLAITGTKEFLYFQF